MTRVDWKHSLGAVIRNSLLMEAGQFDSALPHPAAVTLFARRVELIEVETTSYCNRTCSFCPNSFIDRLSVKKAMPEETWAAILDGLRELDYDGTFVWSRYAEALSEDRLVDRIRQVREAAPRCRICVNSNGDYLAAEYLKELETSGLDRLFIDIYIPDSEVYDLNLARGHLRRFLHRIDRTVRENGTVPELSANVESERLEISVHVRNVAAMKAMDLSDRGGLIQIARKTTRTAPCYAPFKHLVIDWDGSVVPCCQVRSDSPKHQTAVVGRIGFGGVGLVDAYVRLAGWREGLRAYGPKGSVCTTCNVSEYASNGITRTASSWLSDLSSPLREALAFVARPALKKHQRY